MARFIDVDAAPRSIDATGPLVWLAAIALLAAMAFAALYQSDRTNVGRLLENSDFTAYYCAGLVAREHGDPYQGAPMEQCAVGASNPAPLPGYATAFFSIASFASKPAAAMAWMLLLCIAIVLTVLALHVASGISPIAIAAGVIGTDLIAGASFGQISVITVLGIALCAMALSRGRYVPAALSALLTLVQPQIGVPVVLTLLLWAPRARLVLIVGVGALVTLSYLHLGVTENAEYVKRAIPAYGASEVPLIFQYGLSWVLYCFGLDETRALAVSTIQYVVVVAFAVAFAPVVARRLDAPAALAAFPAAAAVLGGPNVHLAELAAAVPLAVILMGTTARTKGLAWFALILLAVPWIALETSSRGNEAILAAAVIAIFALSDRPWIGRIAIALAVAAIVFAAPFAFDRIPDVALRQPSTADSLAARFDPGLAAVQHGQAVRSQAVLTEPTWQNFARKAPDWGGALLALLAGLAIGGPARARPDEPEEPDDEDLAYLNGL